jgi:hypothetical protein
VTTDFWGATIGLNTGLAAVPEGYFWRAKLTAYGWYVLQLRKKRALGSRYIGHSPLCRKGEALTPNRIAHIAGYALTHDSEILAHFNGRPKVDQTLLGDYPPKSLAPERRNTPKEN